MATPEQPLVYETEESCRYLADTDYALFDHDHAETSTADGTQLATYGCKMTLSDSPVREVLTEAEDKLLSKGVRYRAASTNNAVHKAWLCKSILRDASAGYLDFSEAYMQVPHRDYMLRQPFEANLTDEDMPFQAFGANIAAVRHGEGQNDFFVASRHFCYGTLDLTTSMRHVDVPDYRDGDAIYTFTPEERVLAFAVHSSVHVWWQPALSRIGYTRHMPERVITDRLFGSETVDDPYELTRAMLTKFVLNNAETASAKSE
jgi:hypothetical protein